MRSSTGIASPTDDSSACVTRPSLGVACLPNTYADAAARMVQGVLGMARTTRTLAGRACSSVVKEMPAAMEMMR